MTHDIESDTLLFQRCCRRPQDERHAKEYFNYILQCIPGITNSSGGYTIYNIEMQEMSQLLQRYW